MANEMTRPNADEASDALASIEKMTASGLKRGQYPRWYAVALSLWGGTLAATVGSWLWPLVLVGGLIAYYFWRKRTDARIKEIRSTRDLWVVLALSAVVGLIFVVGLIGPQYFDWPWAPLLAGVVVAVVLFAATEIAYRPIRTNQSGS